MGLDSFWDFLGRKNRFSKCKHLIKKNFLYAVGCCSLIKMRRFTIFQLCLILSLLTLYFLVYTYNLDTHPIPWGDEAIYIEPAFNLAKYGRLTNPSMPEDYGFQSFGIRITPIFLAVETMGVYFLGPDLGYLRVIPVIFGLLVLVFTYYLTRRLLNTKIAILATLALALNPLFFIGARLLRPEIAITFLMLLTLIVYHKALTSQKSPLFFLCGLVAAFSFLNHLLIGLLVYLTILILLLISYRKHQCSVKSVFYFLIGSMGVFIPYIFFIAANWDALLKLLSWYNGVHLPDRGITSILTSFLNEYKRWIFGKTAPVSLLPGLVSLLYCLLYVLFRGRNAKRLYLFVAVPAIFLFLLSFFQITKWWGYLVIILPYFSILLGYSFFSLAKTQIKLRVLKRLLFSRCLSIFIFSFILVAYLSADIYKLVETSGADFNDYCKSLKVDISQQSRVMGDFLLWFCFHDSNSFFALDGNKFFSMGKHYNLQDMWDIEYIILGPEQKEMLSRAPHSTYSALTHKFSLVKNVKNKYYGRSVFNISDDTTDIYKRNGVLSIQMI